MERLLVIGLDEPELRELKSRLAVPVVGFEMLPRLRLWAGQLSVESPRTDGRFLPVSAVVFHGIFEEDLPALAALALWGGPCFPGARRMMDCRFRIPCLVRSLSVSRFGGLQRGYADRGTEFPAEGVTVAKWGEWHCGEDKNRFEGTWPAREPTLFEQFADGQAVRIQVIGERVWQFRLGGPDWKKSIHGADAAFMEADEDLVADTRRLQEHFGLAILGVDYIVGEDGRRYLLEVNHIPSVTAFEDVRQAYLEEVTRWVVRQGGPTP
jgi:hypothetical protein